jgi:hypothetical protein
MSDIWETPFSLQELDVTTSNRGVGNPVHAQHRRILNITVQNIDINNALVLNVLDGQGPQTYTIGAGNTVLLKRVLVQSFYFSGAASSLSYVASWPQETDPATLEAETAIAITGTVDTNVKQVAGTAVPGTSGGVPIQGNVTVLETEGGNYGAAFGDSGTIQAGTTNLPVGTLITFTLSMSYIQADYADTHVALVGATSSIIYADLQGQGVISGYFYMAADEKLNVEYNNGDSNGHFIGYTWQGTSP